MSLKSMERRTVVFAQVTMTRLKAIAAASTLTLAAFGAAEHAVAGVNFTGQFGTGNTWNVYESINTPMSFKEAAAFAATRTDPTGGSAVGHLVTLSSVAENNSVHFNAGGGDRWIGLTDRVGAAPGAAESAIQFNSATEGWAWVTGEPFSFQNWGGGEPNNAGPGEDAAHLRGDSLWNDNASGFGENDPEPDPLFHSTIEAPVPFGFIIEWSKNLATQPTGFPMNRPDPILPRVFPAPLTRMPGPNGTASAFGVLEVRDLGGSGSIKHAVFKIQSGGGTRFEGTADHLDLHDPDNGGNQGTIAGPQVPFISDNPGVDDNDIQSIIKGTVQVPAGQGGAYTFNVRSDDGFALRILSQATGGPLAQHRFTSNRNGTIDEDGTLVFMGPTGDSNTQGVVNLSPGTYDVEFATFEDGGGAFWEVSTAKGDFLNPAPGSAAQWLLLGDGATRPQVGPYSQPARLTGNATVKNYARGTVTNISQVVTQFRSNPTPTAEGMVEEAILYDGDDICCGRPAGLLPTTMLNEFPNGGNDQFTTALTGQFQVLDTDGAAGETLTFGLFADDNAALHIIGQSFTGVADFTGDGTATLINPEGGADQWLVADYRGGNTNTFGLITLMEGVNYNFEAFELEETGDSGLEIFVAAGDQLATGFDGARFFPLSTATLPAQFLAANVGLDLVDGPGTGPVGIPGDYNGDGAVNAADYVVWRKTDGSQAGYDTWRTNFGRTSGSGSTLGAVPEPASALLVTFGLIGGALISRRRAN